MAGCFVVLSIIFFVIGFVLLIAPEAPKPSPSRSAFVPVPRSPLKSAASVRPAPAPIAASGGMGGTRMEPELKKLTGIKVGQRIKLPHPVKGELTIHVLGRILYDELWQQSRGPQNPWVTTGNRFAGFWLDGEMLLLNWLNRFYLLDSNDPLSDADIARDFAPHAKKFAQSNQAGNVYFAYPPASWKIDDIGKFQIHSVEGTTLHASAGATGRFIHASGDGGRALVVEDYEGGGGEDCAWIGYQLKEEDIQPA
jgi:hypothetical protein